MIYLNLSKVERLLGPLDPDPLIGDADVDPLRILDEVREEVEVVLERLHAVLQGHGRPGVDGVHVAVIHLLVQHEEECVGQPQAAVP